MITLTIILVMLLSIVALIFTVGTTFLIAFGDLILGVCVIVLIVKLIKKTRKKRA